MPKKSGKEPSANGSKKTVKIEKAEAEKAAPVYSTLSKHELNQFKTLLTLRKRQLLGDVNKLESEALKDAGSGDLSSLPMHMADQGTDNFEQDITLGLMESEGEELKEVEEAMDRIRENTYGICENCKKSIPKPRLKAIPYARLCLACKTKEEGA